MLFLAHSSAHLLRSFEISFFVADAAPAAGAQYSTYGLGFGGTVQGQLLLLIFFAVQAPARRILLFSFLAEGCRSLVVVGTVRFRLWLWLLIFRALVAPRMLPVFFFVVVCPCLGFAAAAADGGDEECSFCHLGREVGGSAGGVVVGLDSTERRGGGCIGQIPGIGHSPFLSWGLVLVSSRRMNKVFTDKHFSLRDDAC